MVKRILILCLFIPALSSATLAQDEIVMKSGDIILARVSEVGGVEIKYKKWDNMDGPIYTIGKSEVFMIKYENGSKDVFGSNENNSGQVSNSPATIYFFRPKKFSGSGPEIIVGTVVPDEVIVQVHNGRWFRANYTNFGNIDFVAGVYSINPERFTYSIEPGKTYYIRCSLLSKGFKMMAELEMVDEATAKNEMGDLKEQTKEK